MRGEGRDLPPFDSHKTSIAGAYSAPSSPLSNRDSVSPGRAGSPFAEISDCKKKKPQASGRRDGVFEENGKYAVDDDMVFIVGSTYAFLGAEHHTVCSLLRVGSAGYLESPPPFVGGMRFLS